MNREIHVRFWEGLGVRFPRATHCLVGSISEIGRTQGSQATLLQLQFLIHHLALFRSSPKRGCCHMRL